MFVQLKLKVSSVSWCIFLLPNNFNTFYILNYSCVHPGSPPNCQCPTGYQLDDIHWICRPWYLKPRTTTHIPIHIPSPAPVHCPQGSLNPEDFVPYCRFNFTVSNKFIGKWKILLCLLSEMNISIRHNRKHPIFVHSFHFLQFNITPVGEYCKAPLVGVPPNCYKPCPAYRKRDLNLNYLKRLLPFYKIVNFHLNLSLQ